MIYHTLHIYCIHGLHDNAKYDFSSAELLNMIYHKKHNGGLFSLVLVLTKHTIDSFQMIFVSMTNSKDSHTLLSQDGHFWKWPESGCNRWNMVNLIHIYAKQCEIMQKNWWKSSNGQIHCFTRGNQLRGAKNMEN